MSNVGKLTRPDDIPRTTLRIKIIQDDADDANADADANAGTDAADDDEDDDDQNEEKQGGGDGYGAKIFKLASELVIDKLSI